jgi:hypothetical protein
MNQAAGALHPSYSPFAPNADSPDCAAIFLRKIPVRAPVIGNTRSPPPGTPPCVANDTRAITSFLPEERRKFTQSAHSAQAVRAFRTRGRTGRIISASAMLLAAHVSIGAFLLGDKRNALPTRPKSPHALELQRIILNVAGGAGLADEPSSLLPPSSEKPAPLVLRGNLQT